MSIVIIGATFVDIKGYAFNKFIPAGRNAGKVKQVHGGVCRNIAEDIARIGLKPTFVSIVDETGTGIDVIKRLQKEQVNTNYIQESNGGLGTWLAIFDNHGDVINSVSQRPNLDKISDLLDVKGDELFSGADSIALEIDLEEEIIEKIFHYAEKYGIEVYAAVSNMSIAMERRELIKKSGCLVCNEQEASMLFSEELSHMSPKNLAPYLMEKIRQADIRKMVVTMGEKGAVYADQVNDLFGAVNPIKTEVKDTTGAGDAFFAGVIAGLTYGKSLEEASRIGTRLASNVIATTDNVCSHFKAEEFGIEA